MPIFELSNGEWRNIPEDGVKKFLKANPDAAYIDDSQPDRYVRYSSYDKYLSRNAQNADVQPTARQAQAAQPSESAQVQMPQVGNDWLEAGENVARDYTDELTRNRAEQSGPAPAKMPVGTAPAESTGAVQPQFFEKPTNEQKRNAEAMAQVVTAPEEDRQRLLDSLPQEQKATAASILWDTGRKPEIGIDGKPYWQTDLGNVYYDPHEADLEYETNARPRPVNTVSAQIMDIDMQLQNLIKKRDERIRELNALEVSDKPINTSLFSGSFGMTNRTDDAVRRGFGGGDVILHQDDDQVRAYTTAIHKLKDALKELKAQRRRDAGMTNSGSFWEGVGEFAGEASNWDFGISDASDIITLLRADELRDGTPEGEEIYESLMRAVQTDQDIQQQYAGNADKWEKAGQVTGQVLPFMVDFFMTAGGFSGFKVFAKLATKGTTKIIGKEALMEMQKLGFKAYVKKYGIKGFGREAGNWAIKAVGTTGDEFVRSAMMANTVQIAKTGTDIVTRKLGDLEKDEDGNWHWENPMTWARAFRQGEGNAVIENMSEMWGSDFYEGAVTYENAAKLAKMLNLEKLSDILAKADAQTLGGVLQGVNEGLKYLGVSDFIGETLEEYVGQVDKTIAGIDDAFRQNPDGSRTNLLFTKDFNEDLWFGMFCSMGLLGAARYGSMGAYYASMKHNVNKADVKAETAIGAPWQNMRKQIDNATNDTIKQVKRDFDKDPNLNDGQKKLVDDYIAASVMFRGYNLGTAARYRGWTPQPLDYVGSDFGRDLWIGDYDEKTDTYTMIGKDGKPMTGRDGKPARYTADQIRSYRYTLDETAKLTENMSVTKRQGLRSYLDGLHASDSERNGIRNRYDLQRQLLNEIIGEEGLDEFDEDPEAYLEAYREYMKTLTGAERDVAEENYNTMVDYSNALSAYDGMIKGVQNEEIDLRVAQSNQFYDSNSNPQTHMFQKAVTRSGEQVYVIGGNVALREDGTIDTQNSDESIIIRGEDGVPHMVSPDYLASAEQPQGAAELKATAAEQIEQTYAQQAADSIDGTVTDFKEGDTYTLTDDQGNPLQITLTADKDGNVVNPDGTINAVDQNGKPMRLTKEMIQQAADQQHAAEAQQAEDERQKRISGNNGTQEQSGTEEQVQEQPEQPAPGTQQEAPQPGSALSRIPTDENGDPIFEQAESPDVAYDAAVEVAEGDVAIAEGSIADEIEERKDRIKEKEKAVKQAQKTLEEAEKAKPQKGTTYAEKVAARKARAEVIGKAQSVLDKAKADLESDRRDLDFWQQMAGVRARREAEAEAQRKADEEAAAKKAQEESEKAAAAAAEQTKKAIEDERKKQQEERIRQIKKKLKKDRMPEEEALLGNYIARKAVKKYLGDMTFALERNDVSTR